MPCVSLYQAFCSLIVTLVLSSTLVFFFLPRCKLFADCLTLACILTFIQDCKFVLFLKLNNTLFTCPCVRTCIRDTDSIASAEVRMKTFKNIVILLDISTVWLEARSMAVTHEGHCNHISRVHAKL